jgi:uncharacterized C2H2 Zn-finger protein
MKYHQTDKSKNSDRLSVLKKVEDKYNYDNMHFPTSYDDIKTFEENNKVCVMVYTTSTETYIENDEEKEELVIVRDFLGNPDYFLNDNINLLRITDNEDNSHYVYIKHVSRLFNLGSTKKDTDNYCPYCNKCFDRFDFSEHINKCYTIQFNEGSLIKLPQPPTDKKEIDKTLI